MEALQKQRLSVTEFSADIKHRRPGSSPDLRPHQPNPNPAPNLETVSQYSDASLSDVIQYGGCGNDVSSQLETRSRVDIIECMTSLIVSMKLFGVYFERRPDVEEYANAWGSQVYIV